MESFLSASKLGASYIEFDVQVTKDGCPVIYHDFLMSETGIDAPLHNLTLEQFMYRSASQSHLVDLPSLAEKRFAARTGESAMRRPKRRSRSLNAYDQTEATRLIEQMKHTFEYKSNQHRGFESYKGNIRSTCIQSTFVTLQDLLRDLPESISFDIEINTSL